MTHVTCRLTAKNRDQLRNPTLGNRVWATFTFFYPDRGARSIVMSESVCVCLSAIISPELHVRSSANFLCMSPMAVARSSSNGVLMCYVFPVLWMTSYFAHLNVS